MNILVYNGPGTTPHSTKHAVETLRRHLSPHYAVIPVSSQLLATEPWQEKTSMLVIPGGADSSIVRDFRQLGIMKKVEDWVRRDGGRYLGFCSGGYFASGRCEFEVGDLKMEVSGPRDLKFFPGVARGCAYKGFEYGSEVGARAVKLNVNPELELGSDHVINYYNGGAVFVGAEKFPDVEVLAEYSIAESGSLDVEYGGISPAAIVFCKIGEGCAVLTGTHPEFVPELLPRDVAIESVFNSQVVDVLKASNSQRELFMKSLFLKLGLKVNETAIAQPHLTPMLLTCPIPQVVSGIVKNITDSVGINSQDGLVHGNKDYFSLNLGSSSELNMLYGADSDNNNKISDSNASEDPDTATKKLYAFTDSSYNLIPERRLTPYFDIRSYFQLLKSLYGSLTPKTQSTLIPGSTLLYSEVITSTSTILNDNPNILASIPSGTLVHSTIQVSGRGRGGNVWVNPHGVLASSLVLDMPLKAPVVFVQYLAAMAVVEAVQNAGEGYEQLPIGIKWPNDVYCAKPEYFENIHEYDLKKDTDKTHVKICGILVNTNVINGKYKIIIGTGVSLDNESPTTSINSTIKLLNIQRHKSGLSPLPLLSAEELLARYIHAFSKLFDSFLDRGFQSLLPRYYEHWFHTGQVVRLQDHDNTRARIIGITDDWGLLEAVEVDFQDKVIVGGKRFYLQPDGNSFDMFKGLISRKV